MERSPSSEPPSPQASSGTGNDDAHLVEIVRAIMAEFAERTGLAGGGRRPRRYLWIDAFAVCNYLELHRRGEPGALESALRLVEQVHRTLGRHREDDPRSGWISSLSEEEGRVHPTCRGLRIGKALGERGPGEPPDELLEWERDGQYFHYSTRWMHALARVAAVAEDERFLQLAVELARSAHAGFTWTPPGGGRPRLFWKMSIDLSRPLVSSMGHHDPLDGLLTFRELRAGALRAGWEEEANALLEPIADMRRMCEGVDWTTADPLGLGGLLSDAYRHAQLSVEDSADAQLLPTLLGSCLIGLSAYARSGELARPASRRLAFRELGLAIGLRALPRLERLVERAPSSTGERRELLRGVETLRPFLALAEAVQELWLDPASQATETWREHLDIDSVMLATSLLPDGYLTL